MSKKIFFVLLFSLSALLVEGAPRTHRVQYDPPPAKEIAPSVVIDNGAFLILTDNSIWEVDPTYKVIAGSWIFPSPLTIGKNQRNDYPFSLTNTVTGETIDVKPSSRKALEEKKQQSLSSQPTSPSATGPSQPFSHPSPTGPSQPTPHSATGPYSHSSATGPSIPHS